jgi:hypothetical protein
LSYVKRRVPRKVCSVFCGLNSDLFWDVIIDVRMKVYHYAKLDDVPAIKGEARGDYGSLSGLLPLRRVGREHQPAWKTPAIFALLEPLSREWVENVHFNQTWEVLARSLGTAVLLEIEVPDSAKAYVIDRGHMEGALYKDKDKVPKRHIFPTLEEAEKAYFESRVLLKDFLANRDAFDFTLPEVIITERIAPESIVIAENQPLLESSLRSYREGERMSDRYKEIIEKIQAIPELARWYETFSEKEETAEVGRELNMKPR